MTDNVREYIFRICGLKREEILARLAKLGDERISFEVEENCLDARVVVRGRMSKAEFEDAKCGAYRLFEDEAYSVDDTSLQQLAGKLLKLNKKVLSVAESLTGGEICSRLVEVPGISDHFYEGIVCYNRLSKMRRLGVSRDTLALYGAVSKQTAIEMVRGLNNDKSDIGLATTGLAGPLGDEGKPVGLVYIAVGGGDFIVAFERRLDGSRNEIRHATANLALFYLVRYLRGDILRLP